MNKNVFEKKELIFFPFALIIIRFNMKFEKERFFKKNNFDCFTTNIYIVNENVGRE